jgi:hypothetical protein
MARWRFVLEGTYSAANCAKKIQFQWARNGGVDTATINVKISTTQPPLQSLNKQALDLLIREHVISPRDV